MRRLHLLRIMHGQNEILRVGFEIKIIKTCIGIIDGQSVLKARKRVEDVSREN